MKISVKGAITLMEKIYNGGQLNTFSVEYFTKSGERHRKQLCSKVNPNAETDFEAVAEKVGNDGHVKKWYKVRERRVIRLYDLEKNHHFSLKTDLLISLNNLKIDHEQNP